MKDLTMSGGLDSSLTRQLLRRCSARLVLTSREEADLAVVLAASNSSTQRIPNGVPPPTAPPETSPASDVLFLARLHARKRPTAFVRTAIALSDRFPDARWALVGPDEGQLGAVQALILKAGKAVPVTYEGTLDYAAVADRFSRASIYVLPSVDEPFPVSLLEALRAGVPSICTSTCGIAPELASRDAALEG